MSISIGSATSTQYFNIGSGSRPQKPDPSQMADKLFSQLDTKEQGYLEKSDLESAFSQLSSDSSSGASVDEVFSALDNDGDNKITKSEMSDSLKKLAEELDSQFNAMRVSAGMGEMGGMGGMGGMPPPPPPPEGEDEGFTEDELSAIATSTTDSKLSTLMSSLSTNFDAADADGDGQVSQSEAMAYQESSGSNSSSETTSSASTSSSEEAVMKRIMDLMQAYGSNSSETGISGLLNSLSVSA